MRQILHIAANYAAAASKLGRRECHNRARISKRAGPLLAIAIILSKSAL
jgi:hypothetical protein